MGRGVRGAVRPAAPLPPWAIDAGPFGAKAGKRLLSSAPKGRPSIAQGGSPGGPPPWGGRRPGAPAIFTGASAARPSRPRNPASDRGVALLHETPLSLLERLRLRPDPASWARLVDLYTPFIRGWLHRQGTQPADLDDLAQDARATVVREPPSFRADLRQARLRRCRRTSPPNRQLCP